MAHQLAVAPASRAPSMLLSAWVTQVQEGNGFLASVLIRDRTTMPVIRLDASLRESEHAAAVLFGLMDSLLAGEPCFDVYGVESPGGRLIRS